MTDSKPDEGKPHRDWRENARFAANIINSLAVPLLTVAATVVGLYATSNRHRTGPYFSQHLVVDKYPEAVAKEFGRPIETLRWGQRVRDPAAMSLITVADVVAKIDAAFAERGIAPVR